MDRIYLDSSVALRTILDGPERPRLIRWMQVPGTTFVSSVLLRTEVIRVLRRDNMPVSGAAALLDRVGLVEITRETHRIAESIEAHIKTLDALHLATALIVGDSITVATHDRNMSIVAQHLGLQAIDPLDTSD